MNKIKCIFGAKNGTVALGEKTADFISFGSGGKTLIMLPGLGDGLKTVKGSAFLFSLMYSVFAERFKVYVFSRVNEIENGCTTKDMARDVKLMMDALEIPSASVLGVSQGGMIAQYLALDYPERVEKLVPAVTLSKPNDTAEAAITAWIEMAEAGDYKRLMRDTAERSYSEGYLKKRRFLLPLLGLTGKPDTFTRFIIQAQSCLEHNAYGRLPEIKCPTLVLGGGDDKIVGAEASREIAAQVSASELFIYNGLGHASYEEAKDFNKRVLDFLL